MSMPGKAGVHGLILHASAWAREELVVQSELQAALEAQSAAVRERDPAVLEAATERVDAAHGQAIASDARRAKLFERFAECWGVAPSTLTLRSICVRAGEGAGSLVQLREELRTAATQVQTTARRVGAELRMHRRVTIDVLGTLLGQDEEGNVQGSGALLSTEA